MKELEHALRSFGKIEHEILLLANTYGNNSVLYALIRILAKSICDEKEYMVPDAGIRISEFICNLQKEFQNE